MQHAIHFPPRPTWGGRRDNAGRKPMSGRRRVHHQTRPTHDPRCPIHVTLRTRPGVPSLRNATVFPVVRTALAAASTARFRLVQFSVQVDHVHLLVEADDTNALQRGLQGLAIRVARAANRVVGRRGKVWWDRYHARLLRTPREVRNALLYVLQNVRKHLPGTRGADPCSSAPWFVGWRTLLRPTSTPAPVAKARTWLGSVGWRRGGGPIGIDESPHLPRCGVGTKRRR